MSRLTNAHYNTFYDVCGVSKGSKRWDSEWWSSWGKGLYKNNKFHICPDCQGVVDKALAIEEFRSSYALKVTEEDNGRD